MKQQVTQFLGQKYLKHIYKANEAANSNMAQIQERNFQKLKKSLQGTAIYDDMKLQYIQSYEDYVKHVPTQEYEFYKPYVDRVIQGEENVLFKDAINYIGLTSGTSGQDSKKIPYNEKMISQFLHAQRRVASTIQKHEGDLNVLGADRLAFGSNPVCYEKNGLKYGYISGILSTRTPKLLKRHTFPSDSVLCIEAWDEKIEMLLREVLEKDIEMLSGIPTYIISVFESILEQTGLQKINQIWPNLKVFVYAATPIKHYRDRIEELVGHELYFYGLYASTEAPLGLPKSSFQNDNQAYSLNPDMLYSFTCVETGLTQGVSELVPGQQYYLNIGTPNGFVHYAMKDIIKVVSVDGEVVFDIVGRQNTCLNVAAEKVNDDNLLNTVIQTRKFFNVDIKHYFVSPEMKDGKPHYHWTLFTNTPENAKSEDMAQVIDAYLGAENLDYKDCRNEGVIEAPTVSFVNPQLLVKYFEANRHKGQMKLKTSFSSHEDFIQFSQVNMPEIIEGVL